MGELLTPPAGPSPYLAIVGRGHGARYRFLQDNLAETGFVDVIWDRRVSDRRLARDPGIIDRRSRERRQPLPDTWTALSFVLTPRRVGGALAAQRVP